MIPNPILPFAVTKLAGGKYCKICNQFYGLNTVVLKYFSVFLKFDRILIHSIQQLYQNLFDRAPIRNRNRQFMVMENKVEVLLLFQM